jgi:hypothetical protein
MSIKGKVYFLFLAFNMVVVYKIGSEIKLLLLDKNQAKVFMRI